MAREASGTIKIEFSLEERLTARGAGLDPTRQPHNLSTSRNYGTGTGSDLIDRVYSAQGSTDGTGLSIDLSGSLTDIADSGLTVVFAKLRCLVIKNTTADGGGSLLVGGVSNTIGLLNGNTDKLVIPPSGSLAVDFGTAGLTVTNSSTDIVKVAASTGTVTYSVVVAGTSA